MNPQTVNSTYIQSMPDRAQQLLQALANCSYDEQLLITTLKTLTSAHPLSISDFPLIAGGYSRTILYRDHSGFEAIIARWSKNAVTPIHGHPQLAFVYLISGKLSMELFEKNDNQICKTKTRILRPGEHFFSKGTAGTYDNAIHRVTAAVDSLSFHIYSDDALKGETFS